MLQRGFCVRMDFGGNDRRRTKGDLKTKRLNRGYKRGGQFRTMNVSETGSSEEDESTPKKKAGRSKKGNKKY